MFTRPAGFQYPEVPSFTEAICAPPIDNPLAPAPMFRNSFEYFLNCAEEDKNNSVVRRDRYSFCGFIRRIFCKHFYRFGSIRFAGRKISLYPPKNIGLVKKASH